MLGHGGSSAGSYLADPTSPIPSHCAVITLFQADKNTWHWRYLGLEGNATQGLWRKVQDPIQIYIGNAFLTVVPNVWMKWF